MAVRFEQLVPDPDRRLPGVTIDFDRACIGCGYNLKGLTTDGQCPECGLPVRMPKEIDAPLSQMPVPVIRRFQVGSWMATAVAAILVAAVVGPRIAPLSPVLTTAVLLAAGAVWAASVWLLTPALDLPQAITRGFVRGGRLRFSARILQVGWLAAGGAALLQRTLPATLKAGPAPDLLDGASAVGFAVGMAGLVVTAILLIRLAEWACDDTAAGAFNLAMWGVPLSTVMLMLTSSILLVGLAFAMLWIVSVAAFPYGLYSLSRSLTWAVHHSRDYADRLDRRRRREDRYAAQVSGTVARMDEARREREGGHRR